MSTIQKRMKILFHVRFLANRSKITPKLFIAPLAQESILKRIAPIKLTASRIDSTVLETNLQRQPSLRKVLIITTVKMTDTMSVTDMTAIKEVTDAAVKVIITTTIITWITWREATIIIVQATRTNTKTFLLSHGALRRRPAALSQQNTSTKTITATTTKWARTTRTNTMVTKAKNQTAAIITELTWTIATMITIIIMKDVQTRSK